ncbi:DUF4124 domain-containing protein [Thermomonas sp.]|jgi:hypothetical protein|uniref:DUF4124 domain-containing protein n=1 Tax=Thermomonas sp. TaxID=1971895 RepID=UPI00257C3923|nr:DUF4124 domain-containing protein [Thermomonas sp.]
MRLLLIGLLLLLSLHAQAESLYRCVTRDGAVSYQSQPCAGRQRLDRVVEYQPEARAAPIAPEPAVSRRQPRRYAQGNAARVARAGGTVSTSQRCRASRAQREAALQRLGLKRTYAQLSALDAAVRTACPGY